MADKALSVRQPWAWLLAAGIKDIENRNWPTRFRGSFYIHAAKTPDGVTLEQIAAHPHYVQALKGLDVSKVKLHYGGIIGRADLVACVHHSPSVWFEGPNGFLICNAKLLDFMPYRGMQGFFPVNL